MHVLLYSNKQEVKIHEAIYDAIRSSATFLKYEQQRDRCFHLKHTFAKLIIAQMGD